MEANSAASDDFIAHVFAGEIADPGHLDPGDAAVIADIAALAARHGLEYVLTNILKPEYVSYDMDDPNLRALIRGHLLRAAAADPDKFFPSPDGPEAETALTRAPGAPEKVLTPDQRATLFATLQARFTSDTERYKDIEWPVVQRSLETAGEQALYALFKLEENGHEVGVVAMEKGGRKGFQFDSCSKVSPAGIRDVDYFRAAEIVKDWSSNGAVDLDLMERDLFEELRKAGTITNRGTWDYLKTPNPGTPEKPGLAWYGNNNGFDKYNARNLNDTGGFRCSLWIPEA